MSVYDYDGNEIKLEKALTYADNGNVGIGTGATNEKLEVSGKIKATGLIIPTNAALGKVLTSDALGNASWNNLPQTQWITSGNNISYNTGNVGIGTNAILSNTKLLVTNSSLIGNRGAEIRGNVAVRAISNAYCPSDGCGENPTGLYASTQGSPGTGYGVYATGSARGIGYGIYATASGDQESYSIYATNSGTQSTDWAGYFDGRTFCSGGVWTASDEKLKDNIKDLSISKNMLLSLKPKKYNFKNSKDARKINLPKGDRYGFLAQDIEKLFPELVISTSLPATYDSTGKVKNQKTEFKAVLYQELIPILWKIVQDQQLSLDTLKSIKKNTKSSQREETVSSLSENISNTVNSKTKLFQNKPNPFTQTTEINFNIENDFQEAFICVFDMTGKKLKQYAISNNKSTSLIIESNEYGSGMFLYSLIIDNKEIDTKRMIIL